MEPYITLVNHDDSLRKKFRVYSGGYQPILEKIGARRYTVTGKLDNQVGPIVRRWRYTILCYDVDPTDPNKTNSATEGYGTIEHLKALFLENTPPNNVIQFSDFVSGQKTGYAGNALNQAEWGYEWTNLANALGGPDGVPATVDLPSPGGQWSDNLVLSSFFPGLSSEDVEEAETITCTATYRVQGDTGAIAYIHIHIPGWDTHLINSGITSGFASASFEEVSSALPTDFFTNLISPEFSITMDVTNLYRLTHSIVVGIDSLEMIIGTPIPVYLVGTLTERNLAPVLKGPCASFLVPIEMVEVLT